MSAAVKTNSRVPELRFPEFGGVWEETKYGELLEISSASRVHKDDWTKSGVPFFRSSDVVAAFKGTTNSKAFISRELYKRLSNKSGRTKTNDVLVTGGGSIGIPYLVKSNEPLYFKDADLLWFKSVEHLCSPFLYAFFLTEIFKKHIKRISHIGTIAHYTIEQAKSTPIAVPSLPEQKKIASFLGAVDGKLGVLRGKHAALDRFKRGLMQKLFSRTLRFTHQNGTPYPDWEEKRLGDIAERCTKKNTDFAQTRVLTNSAVKGVIDQGEYFDKDIANAGNLDGYYIIKEGDFVYNPRISVSAPVGPVKRNNVGIGVMSPLYTVFRFSDPNTEFIQHYFETTFWHRYMCQVANYGARHDRMNITVSDFLRMPIPSPHPEEQQKIADALSAMDAKITVVADQITRLETFKRGLLQKMFV